jgi:hypothetical protein
VISLRHEVKLLVRVRAGQVLDALAWLAIFIYKISMVSSTRNSQAKKKPIGRPRVGSAHFMLTVPPPLLAELDAFRSGLPDKPGRPEATRRLMTLALGAGKKKPR